MPARTIELNHDVGDVLYYAARTRSYKTCATCSKTEETLGGWKVRHCPVRSVEVHVEAGETNIYYWFEPTTGSFPIRVAQPDCFTTEVAILDAIQGKLAAAQAMGEGRSERNETP